MLINLTSGHVLLHPYIDRTSLSFLTYDTRAKSSLAQIHDGIVYEQEGAHGRQEKVFEDELVQICDGYIRTAIPILRTRGHQYVCGHSWKDERGGEHHRVTTVKIKDQNFLVISPGDAQPQIVVDIGVEFDFEPVNSTFWDVLTE